MSGESTEVQLVRLEERLKIIMESMTLDRNARKEQYEKMEEISEKLTVLTLRVGTVEDGFARSAPTIEEFITIKHKVAGAGLAGRWVWVAGAAIISILFTMKKEIMEWLAR